jgi:hypothetical protein
LVWPMFTQELFVSSGHKAAVVIPEYYQQANAWLLQNQDDTRILHLPLAPGESVDYDWGYSGVEPSQLFFRGSSISYFVGLPATDSRIASLIDTIHSQDSQSFERQIATLNIGWIVLHNEVLWKQRGLDSTNTIRKWLDNNPSHLKHIADFGPLAIWKVSQENAHFYTPTSLHYLSPNKKENLPFAWDNFTSGQSFTFSQSDPKADAQMRTYSNLVTVSPDRRIKFAGLANINKENAVKELPHVRFLPNSSFYTYIRLKESLSNFFGNNTIPNCFDLAGKRLAEAAGLKELAQFTLIPKVLHDYQTQLESCKSVSGTSASAYVSSSTGYKEVLEKLSKHLVVLDDLKNTPVAVQSKESKDFLQNFMSEIGLAPRFLPESLPTDAELLAFNFTMPESGDYSLEYPAPLDEEKNTLPTLYKIDDKEVYQIAEASSSGRLSFGTFAFSQGQHEVQFLVHQFRNLLSANQELEKKGEIEFKVDPEDKQQIARLQTVKQPASIAFALPKLINDQVYEISFDYLLVRGVLPKFTITQDSDPVDTRNGQVISVLNHQITNDDYNFYWLHQLYTYKPSSNATTAKAAITLDFWNDCGNYYKSSACQIESVRNSFNRSSEVWIKNIQVRKVLNLDPILRKVKNGEKLFKNTITVQKKSSENYELTVENQQPPFILAFSETYHPAWQLQDMQGNNIPASHISLDGFANAWVIEQPLPQKFRVYFTLERLKMEGIYASLGASALLVILLWLLKKKKI